MASAASMHRLTAATKRAAVPKRGLAAFAPGHYEKGFKEFGPGGRSSVAGIKAALFGGTGFMGKYLQFEMGACPCVDLYFGLVRGLGFGMDARGPTLCVPVCARGCMCVYM